MSFKLFEKYLPCIMMKSTFVRHVSSTPAVACDKRSEIAVDAFDSLADAVTHTGQKYELNDKRRVRFLQGTKYVNPNIARELIAQVPPIASQQRVVWCDGGDPHVGHPKVYINLDKPGNHSCGYCGLRFHLDKDHAH